MTGREPLVVPATELTTWCAEVFVAAGVPPAEARVVATALVDADLGGRASHGVARVSDYLSRLDRGLVAPATDVRLVQETPGTAVLDAQNGWGQVASQAAVELVVDKARTVGVAWVAVRNSNHNGAAGYWTAQIAEAGLVGVSGTNGSPVMVPFGGREASVGTNPLSIAVPSSGGRPIVFDMASSAQARGKILVAAKNDEPIPEGWALDKDGRPTTDARAAWEGILLPMAGPKGSGLALMIDVLAGVLSGANFGATMPRMYVDEEPQQLGHFFLAVDVAAFMPLTEFQERMSVRERETREGAPGEGFEAVYMPGDLEAARAARQLAEGIALSRSIWDELQATAARYGVTRPLVS